MNRPKTMTIYLLDGTPEGMICAYLAGWSGQCIKIPRNLLSEAKSRKEVYTSGIYFLFGESDDNNGFAKVYIGESENVYRRLESHIKEKDFWNVAIVFSSKDDDLTKAHIRFLENQLINISKQNSIYEVFNSNDGSATTLPEYEISSMEGYIDNIKIVLPSLGYDIFNVKEESSKDENKMREILYLKIKNLNASGYLGQNGLVVLKGSEVSETMRDSLSSGYRKRRKLLIDSGAISEVNGKLVFSSDVEFKSPSQAAAIVAGYSVNGRDYWRTSDGRSIIDIENSKYAD